MAKYFLSKLSAFIKEEDGPTAVEYAIMIALILVAMISAILSTGDVQRAMFFDTADDIESVVNGTYQP